MSKLSKAGIIVWVVPAFVIYFGTESLLRQAAVEAINPEVHNIDEVLSQLPPNIRESVEHKIHMRALNDAIDRAKTDEQRAYAMLNLASFTKDKERSEQLYQQVLTDYKGKFYALRAYLYYLENKKAKQKVTAKEFQDYAIALPAEHRYTAWNSGFGRIKRVFRKREEQLEFLMPLLDFEPDFKDYQQLYRQMDSLASRTKKLKIADLAKKKRSACLKLKTLESFMMEKEAAKAQKDVKEKR